MSDETGRTFPTGRAEAYGVGVTSEQASPDHTTPGTMAGWRRQAGFLGAVLAVAAAVIAAGLRFAPSVSAYSGLTPGVFAGLLGFLLVLAGACVLFAVPFSGPAIAPGATTLTILGGLLGLVGLTFAALAVLLAVVLPPPTESVMVQFTDLDGRVRLEYCPALPASFAAAASPDDLIGSATILPVKVSAEVCGNPEFTAGIWIYLNRDAVTVSDQP